MEVIITGFGPDERGAFENAAAVVGTVPAGLAWFLE
jgi:hypothetical protein